MGTYEILDQLLEGCQVIDHEWRYVYVNDAAATHARVRRESLVGHTMMEVYPGIEATAMFTALRACMTERVQRHLEDVFTYPDGSQAWFELRMDPVPDGVFVLSLDITGRKQAELSLQRQLGRLQSLRAIDLAILGTTDLQIAVHAVLSESVQQLGCDAAALFLLAPGTATLELARTVGPPALPAALRVRIGAGVIGRAASERRTITVDTDDARTDPLPTGWNGYGSISATPLQCKGMVTGVLAIACRIPSAPTEEWRSFLEILAGQAAMAVDTARSFEALHRSNLELSDAYDTMIEGWSNALDLRDCETSYHTLRVAEVTVDLARLAGMSPADLVHVRRGALLHDIGKIGVSDAILNKKGPLTEEEWRVMRRHPEFAFNLLAPIPQLRDAIDIPYCHHEKWDGTGYPRQLKGEAIPLAARLFAVVDVWDALCSNRPYREGWPEPHVLDHLRTLAGTHLDPEAVKLFLRTRPAAEPVMTIQPSRARAFRQRA